MKRIKEANDCKVKKLRYIVFLIMSNEVVLSIQCFLSNQTLPIYVVVKRSTLERSITSVALFNEQLDQSYARNR